MPLNISGEAVWIYELSGPGWHLHECLLSCFSCELKGFQRRRGWLNFPVGVQGHPWTPESLMAVQDWGDTRTHQGQTLAARSWENPTADLGSIFFLDIHLWHFMRIIFGKQQEKKSRASVISHSVQAAEVVLERGRVKFKALPWSLISCRAIDKNMPAMRNPVNFFCSMRIFELEMPAAFDNTLFLSRVLFCQQRRESPDFPPWGISRLPSEANYSSMALIGLSEPGEKPGLCNHFQETVYSL